RPREIAADGPIHTDADLTIEARRLDHSVECYGFRVQEPDRRRFLPERLDALGIRGPDVGRLQREGRITVGGREIALEDVSAVRRGQAMAFVMDTRPCPAALEL